MIELGNFLSYFVFFKNFLLFFKLLIVLSFWQAILALCGSFWYMGSILANIVLLCLHNKLDENFELLGASSTRPT